MLICGAALGLATAAAAQEPRSEPPAQQQAAQPSAEAESDAPFEGVIRKLRSMGLFQGSPTGLYPAVTTIYPGGWVAFGGGYRHPFSKAAAFDVNAAWSLKNFKRVRTSLAIPPVLGGHVALEVDAQWMDAPAVAFFGIGNDSLTANETEFAYQPVSVGLTGSYAPWKRSKFGGGLDYISIDTVDTLEGPAEIVEVLEQAPGIGLSPSYLRSRLFAQFDSRPAPSYSQTGGLYRLELEDYSDRSGSRLGFRSLEGEAIQLVPIHTAQSVIALRALTTITDDRAGDDVPFYLMPAIGGSSTLRGYSSFRFRGNHRLLMSAEYRWLATRYLDVAAFYDTGKVATELAQIKLTDLKWNYGVGARVHNSRRTVLRLEMARNDESDWHFIFSMGAAF